MDALQTDYALLDKFIVAREARVTNKEIPWEFSRYHVGSIRREDDTTTKLIYSLYTDNLDNPDIWLYPIIYRTINKWATIQLLRPTDDLSSGRLQNFADYIDTMGQAGQPALSRTSYITFHYKDSGSRLFEGIYLPLMAGKDFYRNIMQKGSPSDVIRFSTAFTGIGELIAVEIAKDIQYLRLTSGEFTTGWDDFTTAWSSYYSYAALNMLAGRHGEAYIPKAAYRAELDKARFILGCNYTDYEMARALYFFGQMYWGDLVSHPEYIPSRAIKEGTLC